MSLQRYVYKSIFKRAVVRIFDLCGNMLFWPLRVGKLQSVPADSIKKILVIRLDHMGDVVLTLPAIAMLKKRFPKARIDVLIDESLLKLVERSSLVSAYGISDHWFSRTAGFVKSLRTFIKLMEFVKRENYGLAIDFRGDLRNIFLMTLSSVPIRLGRPEGGGDFMLTHCAGRPSEGHDAEHNLALIKHIGCDEGDSQQPCFDKVVLGSSGVSDLMLRHEGSAKDSVNVLFHPFAGYPSKEWKYDHWLELAGMLLKHEEIVIYIIGTKEEETLFSVSEMTERIVDLRGKIDAATLPELFLKMNLFVGLDSGPGHIAAAQGLECITLFSGANRSERWRPYTKKLTLIERNVDCSPCESSTCPLIHKKCMEEIDVKRVYDSILKSLRMNESAERYV